MIGVTTRHTHATLLREIKSNPLASQVVRRGEGAPRRAHPPREGRARALTFAESLAAGAIAGVVNNLCTIPFDVVATNHQISGLDRESKKKGSNNKKQSATQGLVSTAREVYAKGGVPAFWAGLGPSCLLVVSLF